VRDAADIPVRFAIRCGELRAGRGAVPSGVAPLGVLQKAAGSPLDSSATTAPSPTQKHERPRTRSIGKSLVNTYRPSTDGLSPPWDPGPHRSRGMPPDSDRGRHWSASARCSEGVDPSLKALYLARHDVGSRRALASSAPPCTPANRLIAVRGGRPNRGVGSGSLTSPESAGSVWRPRHPDRRCSEQHASHQTVGT
jgi:hypothetical protein